MDLELYIGHYLIFDEDFDVYDFLEDNGLDGDTFSYNNRLNEDDPSLVMMNSGNLCVKFDEDDVLLDLGELSQLELTHKEKILNDADIAEAFKLFEDNNKNFKMSFGIIHKWM